jgi:Tol biopolymer transport system component
MLVSKGADMNLRTFTGKTAFNIAFEREYPEIVQFLVSKGADQSPQKFPILEGEYLGQKTLGDKPEIFAKGIVSSPEGEHGTVTFSPDGKTIYWTSVYKQSGSVGAFKVFSSHVENNRWTRPEYAFFTGELLVNDDVPYVSPDGKRIVFMSKRPIKPGGSQEKENYWIIEKSGSGWSEPKPISEIVGRMTIRWKISMSKKGTLYFGSTDAGGRGASDIYMSRFSEGEYSKPENLGDRINTEFSETAPFISPDENTLIFGRQGYPYQSGKNGLYISYLGRDGKWTEPIHMGETINSGGAGNPYVTPDGQYLFFNSGRNGNYDIYWVSAMIIDELRPKELK